MNNSKQIPRGYKPSPLGPIPNDWEVKRLGEITSTFKSGIGITSKNIFENGKYPVYGGNGLRGFTNTFTHDGDYILIGRQGALCGNIVKITGKSYVSEHAIAVRVKEGNDNLFLAYKLDFLNLNRLSESSAQPGLSVEKLTKIKLTVPPKELQAAISKLLNTWDKAINALTQLILQKEQRRRWLMQQLLTGRMRLKGSGGKWTKFHYSQLLDVVKRSVEWNDGQVYHLISVRRRSGGIFERESLLGSQIKVKDLRTVQEGDFLFSKMQIVHGASALVEKKFAGAKISGSYIAVVASDSNVIDMQYFNWYSRTPYFYHQTYISSYGVHIEKMTFDFESFLTLDIALPSIREQKAIVQVLSASEKELKLTREKLDRLKEQKKGWMQLLLSGKKRLIPPKPTKNG